MIQFLLLAISLFDIERLHIEFDKHWGEFLRKEFGCPVPDKETLYTYQQCKPGIGEVDREEFNKARELAKKVFELKDK
jgi:hypothetical protein